jgi:two-component system chemotaxis sensor kinase CheA
MHLVRNSVDHGLEQPEVRAEAGKPAEGIVRLTATQAGSEVALVISDDGGGIDLDRLRAKAGNPGLADHEAIDLIFQPGVSTAEAVTDLSGRGVGLDVVRDALGGIRGRIDVRTNPGHGTEFHIRVPMTLAAIHSLLLSAAGGRFAIPLQSVVTVLDARGEDRTLKLGDERIPLSSLTQTLGLDEQPGTGPAVVLEGHTGLHAFRVDRLLGQRAVVVKELGDVVPRLELVAGASIEPDGSVMLVLDAPALVERAARAHPVPSPRPGPRTSKARVLVVDDTEAVRELERTILERAGYDVVTAGDGKEALVRIAERAPDIVLTDVEMPELDGLQLVQAIRATPRIAGIPVVIVSTLAADDDRLRGLGAGADAYLVKSSFDDQELVATVERLLGSG